MVNNKKRTSQWNTQTTRTMILCSLFGIFGAHKFYTGHKKTGICFILLDLTIVGLVITAIWSFINLVQLTIKKDNTEKEFIIGLILLLIHGISSFSTYKKTENIFVDKNIIKIQKSNEPLEVQKSKLQEQISELKNELTKLKTEEKNLPDNCINTENEVNCINDKVHLSKKIDNLTIIIDEKEQKLWSTEW